MSEFALVQDVCRITTGTQTFTSGVSWTPKGALLFVTDGLTNGTVANHALMGIGATDGTNQMATSTRSRDAISLGSTSSAHEATSTDCLRLHSETGTEILNARWSAWGAGSLTINVLTAPTNAYRITVLLIGGTGVSNVATGTVLTSAVIGTPVVVNVGFEPTFLIVFSNGGDALWNDVASANGKITFGFVQNDGANPHPQYCANWNDTSSAATTSVIASLDTTTVSRDVSPTTGREVEIESFTATGFSATTRASANAATVGYVAVKLTGLSVKAMAVNSPTALGAQAITGIGFTPQFGLLAMTAVQTADTRDLSADAEVFAVSAFTSAAQYCHAITSDDAEVVTTNCESVVHNQPVFLRKDAGTFMSATFTSFTSDTATLNYTTVNGTVRKWAALFVQDSTGPVALTGSAATSARGTTVPNFEIPL